MNIEKCRKMLSVYIHIPFCKHKCYYCDFLSFQNQDQYMSDYIIALKQEIKYMATRTKDYQITTIYLGGGTPSYIDSRFIVEILNFIKERYNLNENAEITVEINPGTVNLEKIKDYKNVGINRVSIGLQSTENELLKSIGRIHTYEQFLDTYEIVRNQGIENINVDLMIALPNQTIQQIKTSLEKIVSLNSNHISVYSLILEEGTKLYTMAENKQISLPDEELERNMYWYVKNTLERNRI